MLHSFKRLGFRFCQLNTSSVQGGKPSQPTSDIPVHLRPYDAKKYEVPSTKLKLTTGFAFLDVEPMPRAKIMKICYIVLDRLKKEIPEGVLYRVYTEEKLKYIMRLTDSIEDIRRLENEFGQDTIEMFIQSLHGEIQLVEEMKHCKPWELKSSEFEMLKQRAIPQKHLHNEKPAREQTKFIN